MHDNRRLGLWLSQRIANRIFLNHLYSLKALHCLLHRAHSDVVPGSVLVGEEAGEKVVLAMENGVFPEIAKII